MGDRYEFTKECPNCKAVLVCVYAGSCEMTIVGCPRCGKRFDIILKFELVEKKK